MAGQVVQITINVTDGNAAEAVQQVVAQLNAIGPAGAVAGAEAGAGLDQVGDHALSAKEKIRLASEEMGIHVPRAMQSVMAGSELLVGALGAIGPAMIAIGGVDIFMMIGEKVVHAYEKWVMMKDEIAATEGVIKSFGDAAASALEKQNSEMERYIRITQGAKNADIFHLDNFKNTPIDLSKQFQTDEYKELSEAGKGDFEKIVGDQLKPENFDKTINAIEDYNALQHQLISRLSADKSSGQYSQFQGMRMARQIEDEERRIRVGESILNEVNRERSTYNASVNAQQAQIGKDKSGTEDDQKARAEAKQTADAIAALEEKNKEAQLSGIELLDQQRKDAEADYVRAHGQSAEMNAQIDQEYLLKYIALNDKEAAENTKKNDKTAEAQRQFNQEIDQITMRSDNAQATGYARIADEAEKSITQIEERYRKYAQTEGVTDAQLHAARIKADQDELNISENMGSQMEQLHQKTMSQIAKEEEQTARLALPEWQQSALAIQDAWQDKTRAINEDEDQQLAHVKGNANAIVMIEQDAAQKRIAADALMNAQLQKNSLETRDKIAGDLQSIFSDPAKFFEKRAMDTAFQLMANEMLGAFESSGTSGKIMQYLFGMGPEMSTSANPAHALGSIFGSSGGQGTTTPGMMQFQQGSTTLATGSTALLTGSQALLAGSQALLSAASTSAAGGLGGLGSGFSGVSSDIDNGGFSLSDLGGSGGMSLPGIEAPMAGASSGAGLMAGGSGSYTTAAGNSIVDASSLGPAGGGESSSLTGVAGVGGKVGKAAGMVAGGITAGLGIYNAYENSDPMGGLASGAMGGLEIGMAFGPVGGFIGAIAGGIGGLVAGLLGDKGKGKAESLDKDTIQPALLKDMKDYQAGRAGYSTLTNELNTLMINAKKSTFSMGSGAQNYYDGTIQPEIQAALDQLTKEEKGGRGALTWGAAQYHSGGLVGDFGEYATGPGEGLAKMLSGEYVVQPMAARSHAPLLSAINAGNVSYASTSQPRMPASSSGGGAITLNIHAMDSKSVEQWARSGGGRSLVAAINQAQRQYSGVGRG